MSTYFFNKKYSDIFAYDMDKLARGKGEVVNEEAINNSIDNILLTSPGERFFQPYFGTILPLIIFEQLDENTGEQIIDSIVEGIKRWEDRVTILEDQIELNVFQDTNSINIVIPYIINRTGVTATFARKITL